jgi:hypothetical protein
MEIDKEWSIRESRSFTSWGYRLAQRVWAEEPIIDEGIEIVRLHARTPLVRNIREESAVDFIAALNRFSSMNALVYDREKRTLTMHSAAHAHAGSMGWVGPLFYSAVSLQAADAHRMAPELAEAFGGEPDYSSHPRSGQRKEPDDLLTVLESVFRPHSEIAAPYDESDFEDLLNMQPRPWVLATGGGLGITAEFAFSGTEPAIASASKRLIGGISRRKVSQPQTALFQVRGDTPHPALGNGAFFLLNLPIPVDNNAAARLANELNLAETREWSRSFLFGAWCPDHNGGIAFTGFLPLMLRRKGILDNFALNMAIKTMWASERLLRLL